MLKQIWAIAKNTYRETIRDRVLYSLIGFSVLVIAASLLAASVSLGQESRVIQDFGLTAMLVFLLIITVFIGTQLVYREEERKTIYLVLSKPISRDTFYLGKYIGLCLTLATATAIMGIVFISLVAFKTHTVTAIEIEAIIGLMVESWLLTAVGMLFASFTSPLSSAIYTFALALVGHSSFTIWTLAQKSKSVFLKYVLETVYYVFPNLEKFNFRNDVVFHVPVNFSLAGMALLYFVGYAVVMLALGITVFRKNEY